MTSGVTLHRFASYAIAVDRDFVCADRRRRSPFGLTLLGNPL